MAPMTDQRFRTVIELASGEHVGFQDYFVRLRHSVAVRSVGYEHDGAVLSSGARAALESADVIVIAPSNPIVSIGPVRSLPDVDDLLAARRESVVAVSPIVGGAAIKGPADHMMRELGIDPSVAGVASLYSSIAGTLVVDHVDSASASRVEQVGMRCVITATVMSTPAIARSLAEAVLTAAV